MDSNILINEIIKAKNPIIDPKTQNALKWEVPGSISTKQAATMYGTWQLSINPTTNTIYHFNFTRLK